MQDETREHGGDGTLGPITFYIREPGATGGAIVTFVGFGALSLFWAYCALAFDGTERPLFLGFTAVFAVVAVGLPLFERWRSRRLGEMIIDPIRGEMRMERSYHIPFSSVRAVEVVQHEYTYRATDSLFTADMTGWAIDIGGGHRLFGENGLSRERVAEIADALKVRVEAYRARTGQGADPLPRPDKDLLERIAGSLHAEGEVFQEDWLALDGPMAEWMREFNTAPDEQTMGRNGEFAQALRKAGYDFGEALEQEPR